MGQEQEKDEWGMTRDDWRWLRWEQERDDLHHRWRALLALWCEPVTYKHWNGQPRTRDGRGDDWTWWRSVLATVAVVVNRRWCDRAQERYRAKHKGRHAFGSDLAFWDARGTYGGWECMCLWLYPGLRMSIFSDGD